MQKDVKYWDMYYSYKPQIISKPSGFGEYVLPQMEKEKMLLDLGCGNGRDSVYFCNNGLRVTAIDSSQSAIDTINSHNLPLFAVCDDFVTTRALDCLGFDYCYARWVIHAINQEQQDILIPRLYQGIKKGGLLFIEVRTVNDVKYGQGDPLGQHEFFYDNHYRRFIEPDKLMKQLTSVGFGIISHEESDSFSVEGDDAPTLLRLVAEKRVSTHRD